MHLNDLAKLVKQGCNENELVGLIFNTIGVSDGISMGTPGMRYSLPSRDLIADSIETVIHAMSYDGLITVVGCDKNMPGALMAMLRINRPSILVYGGTIASGCHNGKKLDVVSVFEAWGAKVSGGISQEDYDSTIEKHVPGQEPVGVCTPQIPWLLQLRLWEWLCPIILQSCSRRRKVIRKYSCRKSSWAFSGKRY